MSGPLGGGIFFDSHCRSIWLIVNELLLITIVVWCWSWLVLWLLGYRCLNGHCNLEMTFYHVIHLSETVHYHLRMAKHCVRILLSSDSPVSVVFSHLNTVTQFQWGQWANIQVAMHDWWLAESFAHIRWSDSILAQLVMLGKGTVVNLFHSDHYTPT